MVPDPLRKCGPLGFHLRGEPLRGGREATIDRHDFVDGRCDHRKHVGKEAVSARKIHDARPA